MKHDLAKQSSVSRLGYKLKKFVDKTVSFLNKFKNCKYVRMILSCVMYSLARQFFCTSLVSRFVIKMLRVITHEGSGFFRRRNQKWELSSQEWVWHDSDRVTDYISIKSNWKIKSYCGHPNQSLSKTVSLLPSSSEFTCDQSSIRHGHSSSVKHSRCSRWGLHSNLWNSLNFLTILQRLSRVPKKAAKRHYTFLFRFCIRIFDTHHLHLAELNSCACCSCDKPSKGSWFLAQLSPSLIRRNGMHHVQATSSSLMLYPLALILTF